MRPLPQRIRLEDSQRQVLEQWVRAHSTPQQVVKRCQIILQSAEGKSDKAIARQLGINRHTCRLWRERFVGSGIDSLWEIEPGRGRKVQLGLAQRIIEPLCRQSLKGKRIGARVSWPRSKESIPAPWRASGRSTNSNLIGKKISNSHGMGSSFKSCSM